MMMKKVLLLCAAVFSLAMFTACSSDDNEPDVVCPVAETTFDATNGLELTYSGQPMAGKQVKFTPNATDPTKATITLSGYSVNGVAMGSGVIPGSTSLEIPVTLSINGDKCSFKGESKNDVCTFNYTGEVSAKSMKLAISNAKLVYNPLADRSWYPAPVITNDMQTEWLQSPIHLTWESSAKISIELAPGYPMELAAQDVVLLALRMAMIPAGEDKISAEQMLCNVFKSVTFNADGNIAAKYIDAANGGTEVVDTPANVAQYVVSDKNIVVYVNTAIVMNSMAAKADTGVDVNALIQMLANGIPLTYEIDANGMMHVYLGTEVLLPILKSLTPILQDQDMIDMITAAIAADPEMASFAPMITGIIKSLPAVIEGTSKIEIGLNLLENK